LQRSSQSARGACRGLFERHRFQPHPAVAFEEAPWARPPERAGEHEERRGPTPRPRRSEDFDSAQGSSAKRAGRDGC
jgi:hypothetical protein